MRCRVHKSLHAVRSDAGGQTARGAVLANELRNIYRTVMSKLTLLKPDAIEEYEGLHVRVWPGVLQTIAACNMRNYSIFRHDTQLFAYFEYVGDDFAADMALMAADPITRAWWQLTEPLQEPLADREDGTWWSTIKEVFHVD